jgi:hypothetical protein
MHPELSKQYTIALTNRSRYSSLLLNSINHPNRRGMLTFVQALMTLFPQQ